MSDASPLDHEGLLVAIKQARKSYSEGGIPIGAALIATPSQEILGSGHNQRIQKRPPLFYMGRPLRWMMLEGYRPTHIDMRPWYVELLF